MCAQTWVVITKGSQATRAMQGLKCKQHSETCPLDFPPERTVWKGRGRKSNFPMEKTDKPDLHQVIKVKSTVISQSDST